MSAPPLNVLICGKIRDVEEFCRTLDVYRRWRASGLVSRIVFSGWNSDWESHKFLIQSMSDDAMEIILPPEPNFIIHGYIFHQMKALRYGLSQFDPQELILKTRTDKAHIAFDVPELIDRFLDAPLPAPLSPFQRRIIVLGGLIFHPYFFNDMLYVGLACDLDKLSSFDLWIECYNTLINAEQALHAAPFIARNPMVRDYFMVNPGLCHADEERAILIQLAMINNPFYQSVLASSLRDLRDNYVIGFNSPSVAPPFTPEATVSGIIAAGSQIHEAGLAYLPGANSVQFNRMKQIEGILDLPVSEAQPQSLSSVTPIPAPHDDREILGTGAEDFSRAVNSAVPGFPALVPTMFRQQNISIYPTRTPLIRMRE